MIKKSSEFPLTEDIEDEDFSRDIDWTKES